MATSRHRLGASEGRRFDSSPSAQWSHLMWSLPITKVGQIVICLSLVSPINIWMSRLF